MSEEASEDNGNENNDVVKEEVAWDPPTKDARRTQWLIDRTQKNPNHGEDSQPPCMCCYVPPPVKWCPGVLEQNCCCETLGSCGLVDPENASRRRCLMIMGLISNICGLLLTIVSTLAITTDYDLLRRMAFSEGEVDQVGGTAENAFASVDLWIGLQAAAIDNPNTGTRAVLNFDDFCDLPPDTVNIYFPEEDCDKCADVSTSMIATLIVSIFPYFPSVFTNITRMYINYDVNCQKLFGIFTNAFSVILTLNTLLKYKNACFDAFHDGTISFDDQGQVTEDENPFVIVDFDWRGGAGIFCLAVATGLKIVDIVAHVLLPTPNITRDHKEQEQYEQQKMSSDA